MDIMNIRNYNESVVELIRYLNDSSVAYHVTPNHIEILDTNILITF